MRSPSPPLMLCCVFSENTLLAMLIAAPLDGKIIDGFHLYVYLLFYIFTSVYYFYKSYFLNVLRDGMLNEIFLMLQTNTNE